VPAKLDDFNLVEAIGASPEGISGIGARICKQKKVCGKKKSKKGKGKSKKQKGAAGKKGKQS
jgi:hypothetical protein